MIQNEYAKHQYFLSWALICDQRRGPVIRGSAVLSNRRPARRHWTLVCPLVMSRGDKMRLKTHADTSSTFLLPSSVTQARRLHHLFIVNTDTTSNLTGSPLLLEFRTVMEHLKVGVQTLKPGWIPFCTLFKILLKVKKCFVCIRICHTINFSAC